MAYNSPKVLWHVVAIGYGKGQVSRSGQGLHGLQAELVLSKGMDIGVVPEGRDFKPLVLQGLHHVGRAGATAYMKQNGRHLLALATSF